MRRGICGSSLNDLGLLSNFKSVRINILLKKFLFFLLNKEKTHNTKKKSTYVTFK